MLGEMFLANLNFHVQVILFFVDSEATSENATFLAPTNHRLVSSFYFCKTNYEAFMLFYLAPCSYVVVLFFVSCLALCSPRLGSICFSCIC